MTQTPNFDRAQVENSLKFGFVRLRYKKVNGDDRVLYGTLQPQYIDLNSEVKERDPDEYVPERTRNPDQLNVFDVEKNSWRSARFQNITEVHVLTPFEVYRLFEELGGI